MSFELSEVNPMSREFQVDAAATKEEVDLDEMPDGKVNEKFMGARNSVFMAKDGLPHTEIDAAAKMAGVPGFIQSYSRVVSTNPCICWNVSLLFMFFFGSIGFILRPDDIPDFGRADKGFETRGSDLAGATAVEGPLFNNALCRGLLTSNHDGTPSFDAISYWPDDEALKEKYTGSIAACGYDYCCGEYDASTGLFIGGQSYNNRCPSVFVEDCRGSAPPVEEATCADLEVTDATQCDAKCTTWYSEQDPPIPSERQLPGSFQPQTGGLSENVVGCKCLYQDEENAVLSHHLCVDKLSRRVLADEVDDTVAEVAGDSRFLAVPDWRDNTDRTCGVSASFQLEYEQRMELVFAATGDDLMNTNTLKEICKLDETLRNSIIKPMGYMEYKYNSPSEECWSRQLGNMVAYYYDVESCDEITDENVEDFRAVLKTCAPFYNDNVLKLCKEASNPNESCYVTEPDTVPDVCFRENIVFDTLNAMVDTKFIQNGGKVKYTKLILPEKNWGNKNLYEAVHEFLYPKTGDAFGSSTLEGYKSGEKMDIFTKQLLADNVYSGGAFSFVFCLMWLHTSSGFISTFAFIQIFMNLYVAYGIYMVLFNLPFFPFLNLVGLFVVIGIGADDVFVFMDSWKQTVQVLGEDAEISDRMAFVLHRAGGSMFITSLTTSSAFIANAMSPVTSLRCFGLFCAIVIIVDYFLMLCYVPALVIIYEKYVVRGEGAVGCVLKPMCCQFCRCCTFCQVPQDPKQLRPAEKWFQSSIGPFVLKGKFVFLTILVGTAAFLSVKASQLSRSTSAEFQTFKPEHPMERYDLELKNYFNLGGAAENDGMMGATFVFGLYGEDNGNHWDPEDWGKLEFVSGFKKALANVNTQERMADMCENVKGEPWYRDPCIHNELSPETERFCRLLGEICPMRNFKHFVTTECAATSDDLNVLLAADCSGDTCWDYVVYPERTTCCGLTFPVQDEETFHTCFKEMAVSNDATKSYRYSNTGDGLWFTSEGEIAVVKSIFPTNMEYQAPYEEQNAFYEGLVSFNAKIKKGGMSSAFFETKLRFYDLQRSLSEGAYQSAGLSFLLAFIVLAITTRNPLLTVLSLITIFCIVGSIVGVLVMDGWQLNILESIIISVAVGMSVDFVAHYSHSYLHAEGANRDERVLGMMSTMGVSVLTGAITTFVAGFFMSLAQTLFFYQFGVFMMSTMGFAWIYTNFMFAPLLSIAGPRERAVAVSRNHGISDPKVEISAY